MMKSRRPNPFKEDFSSSWFLDPEQCKFCGKLAYLTEEDAAYAAREQSRGNLLLRTYKCPYEKGWHLSSKGKS